MLLATTVSRLGLGTDGTPVLDAINTLSGMAYRSPPDTGPRAQHPKETLMDIFVRPLGYWSAGYEAVFGGFGRNHHGPPCFGGGRNPPLRGENGINKLVAGLLRGGDGASPCCCQAGFNLDTNERHAKLYPAVKQASSDHCIPGVTSSTGLKLVAYAGCRLTRPVN
eukprot:scaffold15919_cov90-Cyclotella_meneghiniana.AAC.5